MKPITPSEVLQQKKKVFTRKKSFQALVISLSCTFLATVILLGVIFGLANVRVTTAGGVAHIKYLESEKAEEIAAALIGTVNRIMKETRNEPE